MLPNLTANQILAADDLAREAVEVPEWGGTVYVRVMTGDEKDAFDESNWVDGDDGERRFDADGYRARLACRVLCDPAGKNLFDASGVLRLGAKSAKALDRVLEAARRLNGIGVEAHEAAVKNSPGEASGASSSDSASPSDTPAADGCSPS